MRKPVYKIDTKEINGKKYLIGYQLVGEADEPKSEIAGENLFGGELPRELFDNYLQPMHCFDDFGAIVKNPLPAPEKVLLERELKSLNDFLNSTDWYIIRLIERGGPVPEEVSKNRSRAINRINEIKALLEKL
ncbi:hypothetical protein [Gracilinema caldarium]|uniref:hypothetical protein n=1 Tax=Gracilinema caldarium TaxID=215591 RepID=UPI0026EB76E5|nr:hypothetical protein [Gracilinema caldarium]